MIDLKSNIKVLKDLSEQRLAHMNVAEFILDLDQTGHIYEIYKYPYTSYTINTLNSNHKWIIS